MEERLTIYQCCDLLLQLLLLGAVVATLVVYKRLLDATKQQVTQSDVQIGLAKNQAAISFSDSQIRNTLAVTQYLQSKDVRDARGRLFRRQERHETGQWSQEDEDAASLVCASFDYAQLFAEHGLIHHKILINWGQTITRCYAICEPIIERRRKTYGPGFWRHFTVLNDRIPIEMRWPNSTL